MRIRYALSIALIVVATIALAAWNPERHTTLIIVGFIAVGVLVPEIIAVATRRSHQRR